MTPNPSFNLTRYGAFLRRLAGSIVRHREHHPAVCRSIKTLSNFEPPATELEVRDASLQFVRKLSGFSVPSRANEGAFEKTVEDVAATARKLIEGLVPNLKQG